MSKIYCKLCDTTWNDEEHLFCPKCNVVVCEEPIIEERERIFDNPKENVAMKIDETTYRFPVESWVDMTSEIREQHKIIKELEEALSESEVLKKQLKIDFDKCIETLEVAQSRLQPTLEQRNEAEEENELLKKLLIKEWGG